MQEICQSGSEGGAKPTLSLPLSESAVPSVIPPDSSRTRRSRPFFPACLRCCRGLVTDHELEPLGIVRELRSYE